MKILNLYAGIGGNRRLWGNENEITAVERDETIAKIYKYFFPKDTIIVGDAHEYLLKHYKEFDFIWSSPPCQTHTRMRTLHNNVEKYETKYPDMKLYEEILFLEHFFKGKWCVENVISYYTPLIKPQSSGNHYFFSNFDIPKIKDIPRQIINGDIATKEKNTGFSLAFFDLSKRKKRTLLNNCVNSEIALSIFRAAFKEKQEKLAA